MALGDMSVFRIFLIILVVCIFVQKLANGQHRKLSAEEEIQFVREFKLRKQPAVKIIKTVNGELYSCIDFYQQPTFDHPLMRNHTYNYDQISENKNVSSKSMFKSLWTNGEGCPPGTVPVRKYTKNEFLQTKLFQQQMSPMYYHDHPPGRFRSVVHTPLGAPDRYHGASGRISVYNLPVKNSQYTAGYLCIRAGGDGFQVGWMVDPFLFKDNKTRLFVITKVGISKCVNTLCPGFVITNRDIPIDADFEPVSQQGGDVVYDFKMAIVRNPEKQQWQLQLGDDNKVVGFWPNELLNGLSGPAEYAEWGGEAYSPTESGGPGMGSGVFPTGNITTDGYVCEISIYNENGTISDPTTQMYSDDDRYYKVFDNGYVSGACGHLATFGGPGPQ